MVEKEGLSAYKRYKLRIEHANGGEHMRAGTLIDWLQRYNVNKFQSLSKGKPRPVSFFPHSKSNPTDDEYEDYLDGLQAETFQEAYELCCDHHTHGDDLYDELDVDDDEAEPDADDELKTLTHLSLLLLRRLQISKPTGWRTQETT
ncbi:hypothetical protein V1524DRAFT_411423 [Lipomyces starkeyi]